MREAVVLLSGGLDSATSLAWARREGWSAHALTVDYRQRHSIEVSRAGELARRLGAATHRTVAIDLTFLRGSALTDRSVEVPKRRSDAAMRAGVPATYVPARNTLFLAVAAAWAESIGARDLVIGVNTVDFSGYPDCRPEFLAAFERVAEAGTKPAADGRHWRVHAPLAAMSKAEIVRSAVAWGVPCELTISCYDPEPDGRPCDVCDACRLRARGFLEAGLADPALAR
jgi:7-cyano-7-deazaguanine synthase